MAGRLVEIADKLTAHIASIRRDQKRSPLSLVVEDDELDRELARRALEAAGHQVHTARDGEEALAVLAQKKTAVKDSIWCF